MQMLKEQSVSLPETGELCVSMDVSRGYTFTFPSLFFSPEEDGVESSCASAVSFSATSGSEPVNSSLLLNW